MLRADSSSKDGPPYPGMLLSLRPLNRIRQRPQRIAQCRYLLLSFLGCEKQRYINVALLELLLFLLFILGTVGDTHHPRTFDHCPCRTARSGLPVSDALMRDADGSRHVERPRGAGTSSPWWQLPAAKGQFFLEKTQTSCKTSLTSHVFR